MVTLLLQNFEKLAGSVHGNIPSKVFMLNILKDSIIMTSMFTELILIITSHAGNLPLSQRENSNHSTDILQSQLYSVNFFFSGVLLRSKWNGVSVF